MFNNRLLNKDRLIQERWFRMKLHKKFGRKLQTFLLWRLHRRLTREFIVKDSVMHNTIEATVAASNRVDETLFPATKKFMNIGLYFLLAARDIQAVKADAFAHPNRTKRNIAFRTMLLTIYEWDMGKVTGRHMNNIYHVTGLSDTLKQSLVESLKGLRKSRKAIENKFSEARHHTIAHRESDAMRQYEIISALDINNFSAELTDFYQSSNNLLTTLVSAMLEIGSTESLVHQIINRDEKPTH
jgi:hypothetical protein